MAYSLGHACPEAPTPEDAVTAQRILLDGLARDAQVFELLGEQAGVPVRQACQDLAQHPGHPAP